MRTTQTLAVITGILLGLVFVAPPSWAGVDDVEAEQAVKPVSGTFQLGFTNVSPDKNPARAAEYRFLENSLSAGLDLQGNLAERRFFLDFEYINEKDFTGTAHLDHKGSIQFMVEAQSLYHNLDNPSLGQNAFKPAAVTPWVIFSDLSPEATHALQVEQYGAKMRVKAGTYPAHLSVGYWRLEKQGTKKMRYVDHGNGNPAADPTTGAFRCANCHVRGQTREINRVTEEFKATADAHAGPINFVVEGKYRQFDDREPIPVDEFGNFISNAVGIHRTAGPYQHDEDPESQLVSARVGASTSYSGGVAATVDFLAGKRKNKSELSDVFPVKSETDFWKAAGDFTWMPSSLWTFNLRYRYLDLDNTNTGTIEVVEAADPTQPPYDTWAYNDYPATVRSNPDLQRAWYNGKVSLRPSKKFTLQAEYDRQDVHREHAEAWDLPEDETLSRYRIGFFARPLGHTRHKVNGWYQYRTAENPAYGTTLTSAHEGFLAATMSTLTWGVTANAHGVFNGKNDEFKQTLTGTVGGVPTSQTYDLDRQYDQANLGVGLWTTLGKAVTLNANYAFFWTDIEQDLLFGTGLTQAIENEKVRYNQEAHTYTLGLIWQMAKEFRARAQGQYLRSRAYFDPDFPVTTISYGAVDPSQLRGISQVNLRQYGGRAGLDYFPAEDWTMALDYAYDTYDDLVDERLDGSVQTVMVSLSKRW